MNQEYQDKMQGDGNLYPQAYLEDYKEFHNMLSVT